MTSAMYRLCRQCALACNGGCQKSTTKTATKASFQSNDNVSVLLAETDQLFTFPAGRGYASTKLLQEIDAKTNGFISKTIAREAFTGTMDEHILIDLVNFKGVPRYVLLFGMGQNEKQTLDEYCCWFGRALVEATEIGVKRVCADISSCNITNHALIADVLRCRAGKEIELLSKPSVEEVVLIGRPEHEKEYTEGLHRTRQACRYCTLPEEE